MKISRRQLLVGAGALGGAGLIYGLRFSGDAPVSAAGVTAPAAPPVDLARDYTDWLIVGRDGTVTACTGRVEMGQGLETVLYNLVSQAFDLPNERVRIVLGDTDTCPDDGTTIGSCATSEVGWGYWLTCGRARAELARLAALALECGEEELIYSGGLYRVANDESRAIGIGALGDGVPREAVIDPAAMPAAELEYVDRGTLRIGGEEIVTGRRIYAGDLEVEGCVYGGMLLPPYHDHSTKILDADLAAASEIPGVVSIEKHRGEVRAYAESYPALDKALAAVEVSWRKPARPEQLDLVNEIRDGRKLKEVIEERGDLERELGRCDRVFTETYQTQFASTTPMETETAVADVTSDRATVWVSTQSPFLDREKIARRLKLEESAVRVISTKVGGAFGAKAGHRVADEAAALSKRIGRPVKLVYSRRDQFQRFSRYKEAVIIDLRSGVDRDGRLRALGIDVMQDHGDGLVEVYAVPHVRTNLYETDLPAWHATMRGTSFSPDCFALESHIDSVARQMDFDPVEFRKQNVTLASFRPLLDACAEMAGYANYQRSDDRGLGFAICNHGGRQLGVVCAEVSVDRTTGEVKVEHLWAAYDIGTIINRNTALANIRGAMIWGIGYALFEEVAIDGHRAHASGFEHYRLPRFSDVPPIEVAFLDNQAPGSPRGCGEMPLVPTTGAICNAVCNAIGVRIHQLPFTPERVKSALEA